MKLKTAIFDINRNDERMKSITAVFLIFTVALSGCATSSKDVSANYVSPVQFQSYDCDQLQSESQRIQARVNQLGGRLDEAASNDKALMGVGMLLFWPALFALGGTKQQEADYSRLKGEYEAIQQSSIAKKCPGVVMLTTPKDNPPATTSTTVSDKPAAADPTKEEKLNELKRLFDSGLISPEVYKERQNAVVGS